MCVYHTRNYVQRPPHPVISVYPTIMMEARMDRGVVLVNVVNALKDIVTDCNIECGPEGISLQVRIYTYHTHE